MEDQQELIELRSNCKDQQAVQVGQGDSTSFERKIVLERANIHLEKLLAKANRYKEMLRHMKHRYWARTHVCLAKMKILKARLRRVLRRRNREDRLRILADASLDENDT